MIINWNLISDIIYPETIIEIHNVELIYTRDQKIKCMDQLQEIRKLDIEQAELGVLSPNTSKCYKIKTFTGKLASRS